MGEEFAAERARPHGCLTNSCQHLETLGLLGRELELTGIALDNGDQIIEIVGHAAGE
jgi:hypothetical protein